MIVAQPVDGDPPNPADGIVVVLDPSPVQVRLHEGLLHGVGGHLTIAAGKRQRTHEPAVVRAKQSVNGLDDLDVRDLVHRGKRVHHKLDTPQVLPRFRSKPRNRRSTWSNVAGYAPSMDDILDVDLLAFERGTSTQRAAVVDGVRRSLATGFVYTRHDLSEDLLDTRLRHAARVLRVPAGGEAALHRPGEPRSDRVHRAARRDGGAAATCPTGRRCSTGAGQLPAGIRCAAATRTATARRCCPRRRARHRRRAQHCSTQGSKTSSVASCASSPRPRLPRVVLRRDDHQRCHAHSRHPLPADAGGTRRCARVGRLARRHQPHHRTAARHRARTAGAGRRRMGRCRRARRPGDHQHRA